MAKLDTDALQTISAKLHELAVKARAAGARPHTVEAIAKASGLVLLDSEPERKTPAKSARARGR